MRDAMDPGDQAFSAAPSRHLSILGGLAPGGSVRGTMGSATLLILRDVRLTDRCPTAGRGCAGSGAVLAAALRFRLEVTDLSGASVRKSTESVASLQHCALLGDGLAKSRELDLRLNAMLPSASGDRLQYDGLGFTLRIDLVSVAGESGQTGGNDSGAPGSGGPGPAGTTTPRTGSGNSLIIGGDRDLASRGAPARRLAVVAGTLLAAGLALVLSAQGRRSPHPDVGAGRPRTYRFIKIANSGNATLRRG